jgi:hypothetical protein
MACMRRPRPDAGLSLSEKKSFVQLNLFRCSRVARKLSGSWQAHEQEKKLQDKTGLFIDRTYHLYAIVRRGNEEVPNRLFQPPRSVPRVVGRIATSVRANQGYEKADLIHLPPLRNRAPRQ